MKFKRFLCSLLVLALLSGAGGLAEAFPAPTAAEPTLYTHNGRVTLIDGAYTLDMIDSFEDAAGVVAAVLPQLGGGGHTVLEPWRTLTDAFGNRYYVFQQMYDDTTVLGGAVKVITDPRGNMIGLTSSIEDSPAETDAGEGITAAQAEQAVLDHALQTRRQLLNVVPGLTGRMILPLILEIDMDEEEEEGSRYVWVVYTDNPDSSLPRASELPYLAHYVTTSGEYLYSLPTIIPGDEAGASGFDAGYIFEFMEPVDYTGFVDLSTGEEMELSVTVMRDRRTGMHYLGNIERRIVVADCWEFLYNGNRVVAASSPDNRAWDQVGLLTLYNYCRAYDYYREIGWIGGDGLGTPILVLNDFCDRNHVPVDNAAYVGGYLGWQIFLASQGNDFSQCLDVLAHEFTHCVTHSVMTYNAYVNDYGAINEAMSDIQGKTCQMLMEGGENVTWQLGDRGVRQVRDMENPHRFSQPAFTWDLYYTPAVKTPTELNDQGGVHSNSSLLNLVAYRLYEKGGMTPEEGRAFWFTVDCAMTPGTDYAQLAELLPWALRAVGLEQYGPELRRALDATRLGVETMPDAFDPDRALLTLRLPENAIFDDEQWLMLVVSVNVDHAVAAVQNLFFSILLGDYTVLPPFVQDFLNDVEKKRETDGGEETSLPLAIITAILDTLGAEDAGQPGLLDRMKRECLDWLSEQMKDVFYYGSTNAGQDGRTMRMVCLPGHALPILMHGIANEQTSTIDDACFLVCLGGAWLDIRGLMTAAEEAAAEAESGEEAIPPQVLAIVDRIADGIGGIHSLDDALSLVFYPVSGGTENVLPADSLTDAAPQMFALSIGEEDQAAAQPRLSRPKSVDTRDHAAE